MKWRGEPPAEVGGGRTIKAVINLVLCREEATLTQMIMNTNMPISLTPISLHHGAVSLMIASIKSVFIFICSDPGLPVSILVIICGFQCGFVYAYNCAQLKIIKCHSGLMHYSAVVMNEFIQHDLKSSAGIRFGTSRKDRPEDRTTGTLAPNPAAVWKWHLLQLTLCDSSWVRCRAPTLRATGFPSKERSSATLFSLLKSELNHIFGWFGIVI